MDVLADSETVTDQSRRYFTANRRDDSDTLLKAASAVCRCTQRDVTPKYPYSSLWTPFSGYRAAEVAAWRGYEADVSRPGRQRRSLVDECCFKSCDRRVVVAYCR
ncbi:uncharacterized protein LOC134542271 [Bacillus rossius redtenbacheri]|uniref:uncharacterized protein LOC134542271 n=1 Tax=Bacillus rossius redtenbacheri TaxID=93214 RepID=UPI002FDE88D1